MGARRVGKLQHRTRVWLNPVVWLSIAQAVWIAALVLFIVYAVSRSAQLKQVAEAMRVQGLGEKGEGGWLALGVVLLTLLFVALIFITVSLTKYWSENRAIHRFVSTVSHELRTPLATIRLYLETIQAHDDLSPEQREGFIGTILGDVERLSTSIETILSASRIERHGLNVELTSVELAGFVTRYQAEHAPQVQMRRRTLRTGTLETVSVLANEEALSTVLNNLVDNAVRYSEDGCEVTISVARDRGHALLQVTDLGHGVGTKEVKHLFKMFRRGAQEGRVPGTGLGLYIVRGLVKAMGGQVALRSDGAGKGTTVSISLTVEEGATGAESSQATGARPRSEKKKEPAGASDHS